MKANMIIKRAALLLTLSGMAAFNSTAADYYWDADTATAGAQDGNGTWTATGTDFWNSGANVAAPAAGGHVLIFGETSGGHTITVSNGGAPLEYATASTVNTLRFNSDYTIAGAVAGDGLLVGTLQVNNASTVTISAVLKTTSATRNWDVGGGSTLNLSGGGELQKLRGNSGSGLAAINITGGEWSAGITVGGGNTGLKVTQSGGTIALNASFYLTSAAAGAKTEYVLDGGFLSIGGNQFNIGADQSTKAGQAVFTVSGGTMRNTGSEVRVGNDQGSGVFNIKGGRVELNASNSLVLGRQANGDGVTPVEAELNISGGVSQMQGISFGANSGGGKWAAGSKLSLNLTGGELYLRGYGIYVPGDFKLDASYNMPAMAINLGHGTLGAAANWSSAMNMTLTGSGGNAIVKAADEAGIARNITLSGVLGGAGGLEKTGGGTLLLSGANSYAGDTIVSAGTLELRDALSLGGVADLSVWTGALVNMNYSGTAVIDSLLLDGVTISGLVAGQSYSYDELNTALGTPVFYGAGLLSISAIPEPSTWTLLLTGAALLAVARRRFSFHTEA